MSTTETIDYTFTPERVKHIRIALGLTLQAFADKLGVDPNMVYRWERGAKPTKGPVLKALLDAERDAAAV